MNARSIMKKLQTAILKEGLVVSIDTRQFYAQDQQRMITIFRLTTPVSHRKKTGELKDEQMTILSSTSGIEAIQCLNDIYKAVKT